MAWNMEASCSHNMLLSVSKILRRHSPEDHNLKIRCRETYKYHNLKASFVCVFNPQTLKTDVRGRGGIQSFIH
jgi:hypothetical protein